MKYAFSSLECFNGGWDICGKYTEYKFSYTDYWSRSLQYTVSWEKKKKKDKIVRENGDKENDKLEFWMLRKVIVLERKD